MKVTDKKVVVSKNSKVTLNKNLDKFKNVKFMSNKLEQISKLEFKLDI